MVFNGKVPFKSCCPQQRFRCLLNRRKTGRPSAYKVFQIWQHAEVCHTPLPVHDGWVYNTDAWNTYVPESTHVLCIYLCISDYQLSIPLHRNMSTTPNVLANAQYTRQYADQLPRGHAHAHIQGSCRYDYSRLTERALAGNTRNMAMHILLTCMTSALYKLIQNASFWLLFILAGFTFASCSTRNLRATTETQFRQLFRSTSGPSKLQINFLRWYAANKLSPGHTEFTERSTQLRHSGMRDCQGLGLHTDLNILRVSAAYSSCFFPTTIQDTSVAEP